MRRKLRYAALLGLLLGASCAHAGDFWDKLWRTPDQRGEQLLRQGDAAAAARTFSNPQRKAYAELQAGDYAAAARDFAAFDDSDAHYNRGNALAHAGDLAAALKAYDAALARNPENRDARHNRDLVAQALKQAQPPASSSQGQSGKQTQGKDSGKGSDKGSEKGSQQDSDKRSDKASEKGSEKGSEKDSGSTAQQSGEKQGGKAGQQQQAGQSGSSAAEQEQAGSQAAGTNPAQPPNAGNSATQPQPSGGNEAEQARRDAEAGLGRRQNDRNQPGASAPGGNAPLTGQSDATRSEQQLAQEQWLRQIPDDPGGLLRRKFMIEHLMRQQGNQP
jgi:Ca-activated chloride channel family protein